MEHQGDGARALRFQTKYLSKHFTSLLLAPFRLHFWSPGEHWARRFSRTTVIAFFKIVYEKLYLTSRIESLRERVPKSSQHCLWLLGNSDVAFRVMKRLRNRMRPCVNSSPFALNLFFGGGKATPHKRYLLIPNYSVVNVRPFPGRLLFLIGWHWHFYIV